MMCVRCKKEILPKSNYHKNIEMNDGEEIRTDYIHQTCWAEFTLQTNKANTSLNKANFLLNAMAKRMKDDGILSDEREYHIT